MLRAIASYLSSWVWSRRRVGVLIILVVPSVSAAQVPVLGRWQEFAYSAEAVSQQARLDYDEALSELRKAGQLDDDVDLTARIRRIAIGLIKQAEILKPESRYWHWEIHTTSSAGQSASCRAEGRLLFGSAWIRRLQLRDDELAILIAHEIAHAVAEHQREDLSQVYFLDSSSIRPSVRTAAARFDDLSTQVQLGKLLRIEESEADQLGMTLARMAGWNVKGMVRFYRKLMATDTDSILSWEYPSAASRLSMAIVFARLFGHVNAHTN